MRECNRRGQKREKEGKEGYSDNTEEEANSRIYLEYLSQLMKIEEDCRLDEGLVTKWLECALKDSQRDIREILFDEEGYPLRDAHQFPWKHDALIRPIIDDENHVVYAYDPKRLAILCAKYFLLLPSPSPSLTIVFSYRYGYFYGFWKLCARLGQAEEAIDVVIRTDDLGAFLR